LRGTYTIIVRSESEADCAFGKLGRVRLRKGQYLYTGSALGNGSASLEGRLERHQRHSKKRRWHIDYLTSRHDCRVIGLIYLASNRRLECTINQALSDRLNLSPVLPRIGASDCSCGGHLLGPELRLGRASLLRRLTTIYAQVGPPKSAITERSLN
jgi:Uri superfamily endonuclease